MNYPTEGAKHFAETGESVFTTVLREGTPEGDACSDIIGLMANRSLNTGGGRPSDAARYVVKLHRDIGCEAFRARYEEGAGSSKTLEEASWSLR